MALFNDQVKVTRLPRLSLPRATSVLSRPTHAATSTFAGETRPALWPSRLSHPNIHLTHVQQARDRFYLAGDHRVLIQMEDIRPITRTHGFLIGPRGRIQPSECTSEFSGHNTNYSTRPLADPGKGDRLEVTRKNCFVIIGLVIALILIAAATATISVFASSSLSSSASTTEVTTIVPTTTVIPTTTAAVPTSSITEGSSVSTIAFNVATTIPLVLTSVSPTTTEVTSTTFLSTNGVTETASVGSPTSIIPETTLTEQSTISQTSSSSNSGSTLSTQTDGNSQSVVSSVDYSTAGSQLNISPDSLFDKTETTDPWNPTSTSGEITSTIWKCIAWQTLIDILWLLGLALCGPLRTILLFEHSDLVLRTCFQVLWSSGNETSRQTSRTRGVVFFGIALLVILVFDHDTALEHHHRYHGYAHYRCLGPILHRLISFIGLPDRTVGMIILLAASFLRCLNNSSNQSLAQEMGGAKKFHAISTCLTAVCLIPISLVTLCLHYLFPALDNSVPSTLPSSFLDDVPSLSISIAFISVSLFIFDFYTEQICVVRLGQKQTFRYGTLIIFVSALVVSYLLNKSARFFSNPLSMNKEKIDMEDNAFSWETIFATVMFILATNLLSKPIPQRSGTFIGYGSDGSPLFNAIHQASSSIFVVLQSNLRDIFAEVDSRKIFYFLSINLAFTFVELLYGAWTNSLGLISDGFHMLFDCLALMVGLYAALMSRRKPTRVFTYGYGRVEVLSGFVNGVFLVVVAIVIFYEAIGRLLEPPEIKTERLLIVSVAGFAVNMIGIFSFSHVHAHAHGGGSCAMSQPSPAKEHHFHHHHQSHDDHSHGHSHAESCDEHHGQSHALTDNANMRGIFLHVLADTLGSVGVIISSILIQWFGWYRSDPICTLFISILIFLSVLPLLKSSAMILLLQTPSHIQAGTLNKLLEIEHVLSYSGEHFWNLSSTTLIGTVHVQITNDGNEQVVASQVHTLLREAHVENISIQVEKQVFGELSKQFHVVLGHLT